MRLRVRASRFGVTFSLISFKTRSTTSRAGESEAQPQRVGNNRKSSTIWLYAGHNTSSKHVNSGGTLYSIFIQTLECLKRACLIYSVWSSLNINTFLCERKKWRVFKILIFLRKDNDRNYIMMHVLVDTYVLHLIYLVLW